MSPINRREFLKMGMTAGSMLAAGSASDLVHHVYGRTETSKKMIVLGFDGMDAHILQGWMDQGKLPTFARLRKEGVFSQLQTSFPPQSPVAWSNVITGMNPGGHGVFDFMMRHPEDYRPDFSSTETIGSTKTIALGKYNLPLSGGKVRQRREGRSFWEYLEDHDIPATIFKMPANYPPAKTKQRTLSGMNTPDITGNYGTYNYYTTDYADLQDDSYAGGNHHEVYVIGNRIDAKLYGPDNSFIRGDYPPKASIDFKVYIDPDRPVAKVLIQGEEFILREKEWSGWKRVKFPLMPTQSVSGICMFYLKQIRPEFKLYISPINIDPANPALPISTPESYSRELEKRFGPFFTKGLPADWNAMNNLVLDEESFLEQDNFVLQERKEMLEYELSRFDSGLLFYYLSCTDQRQHMFFRFLDKQSPSYDEKLAVEYGPTIENIYREADRMLDTALQKADKDTIVWAISDHGFAPFRRTFNPNTWLKQSGYHSLINEYKKEDEGLFLNTDWSRTKAYAYGLNSLFLNVKGREGQGIVNPAEKTALAREIAHKLEAYIDPKTGEKPIFAAKPAEDIYSGSRMHEAPDIVIGYNRGYRVDWSSPMGTIAAEVMEDNTMKWSGDHMSAPDIVPGIFLSNRPVNNPQPALYDLAPTILKLFGIETPKEMIGRSIV
ncbi:MAG: alkaline phosphatase family protein [Acidobacteria bacterium]|nr:alkaline phosphatase family protein [Acidobacteriota bacterium]MCG2815891.1 alkaline phosphatase family protein [Candidatus Aminicenantes bacterium]